MNLKTNKIVHVLHFSGITPYNSELLEAFDDALTLRLNKQLAILNFTKGDPAVVVIKEDDRSINIGCNVLEVNAREEVLKLKIDDEESGAEQRRHERFAVSLYADVRLESKDKKYIAIVKDISFFGMKIFLKEDFDVGKCLIMDLYMKKKIIFIKCCIIRKSSGDTYNEYGLRIEYDNYDTLNYMKAYLKNLKEDQEM